jgi:hypothetical protein
VWTPKRIHSELDTDTYALGVQVSNAQMDALQISRHDWHPDWNDTLHPTTAHATAHTDPAEPGSQHTPTMPELTGMTAPELEELITRLAGLWQAHRARRAHEHPAEDARHRPRKGRPLTFPFPDRVIATVLRLRLALSDDTLARLLDASPSTIYRTVKETRLLLDRLGHVIKPAASHAQRRRGLPLHRLDVGVPLGRAGGSAAYSDTRSRG